MITDLLNAVLSGSHIPLPALGVTVLAFVLYRILGKHVDELYTYFRKQKSSADEIRHLQRFLIDEMRRSEEVRALAERFITRSNDLHWQLVEAERKIAVLEAEVASRKAS